jgi:hypothetical protein
MILSSLNVDPCVNGFHILELLSGLLTEVSISFYGSDECEVNCTYKLLCIVKGKQQSQLPSNSYYSIRTTK